MLTPAPIYQSLTRPLQVAGAERKYGIMVIGTTMLLGVLGWYFHSIPCAVAAVAVFSVGMPFLRRLAKKDPHMIEAAQRFYAYKRYYPARSAPGSATGRGRAAIAIMAGLLLAMVAWLVGSILLTVLSISLIGLGVLLLRRAR
jgi:type IV secretory pathway TrbD component